jgi:hypothetical protein
MRGRGSGEAGSFSNAGVSQPRLALGQKLRAPAAIAA